MYVCVGSQPVQRQQGADNTSCPTHVGSHLVHAGCWLDGDTTTKEETI